MSSCIRFLQTVAVGVPLFILLTACEKRKDPVSETTSPSGAYSVSVAPVSRQAINEQITALGTVGAWQELALGAQVSGLAVVEVRVGENDPVTKGDILVRLDDHILNAQIAQQRALIVEAQENLESASRKVARDNSLLLSQAISKETADERRTTLKTSQAKLDQATAVLAQLQIQLDQTRIVAPTDGYVSQKPVVIGTVVQAGTELVRVVRDNRLEIEAKVPEKDIGSVRVGQIAHVRKPGGQEIEARVRGIAAKVDAKTRLGLVYVGLPAQSGFRPGMFARVSIDVAVRPVLTVPEQALIWRDGKSAVFVLDDSNRAVLTRVVTGARQSGLVAIESGLKDVDRIVVAGAGFLTDGDLVRIVLSDAIAGHAEQIR